MAKPKPGKYDHVVTTLAPLPPADAPYQARVDEAKAAFAGLGATQLAQTYIGLRRGSGGVLLDALKAAGRTLTAEEERNAIVECLGKEGIERLEKLSNLRLEACTQLLVASQDKGEEAWGKYGVKDNAMRLETGDTIRVQSEPYGQVKDKEAFRLWCIANGYERQLQLWPTTMNAIVKERAAAGEPYPDGTECFRKDVVKFVKAGVDE